MFDAKLKDADEVLNDPDFNRWFSFAITSSSLVILEKKDLPEHILALENLECAISLQALLTDLEDIGEAPDPHNGCWLVVGLVTFWPTHLRKNNN